MTCSRSNLLENGGFVGTLEPWSGQNIKLVKNPVTKQGNSVLLYADNEPSRLFQTVSFTLESGCAYYLYFKLLNVTPRGQEAHLIADVIYQDGRGRTLNSTPLLVKPPVAKTLKWSGYYAIVPPPPRNTRLITVLFKLSLGRLFVDYIALASHDIGQPAQVKESIGQVKQIH